MPDITLSIPEEVYKKMKEHNEIRWTEVVKKVFKNLAVWQKGKNLAGYIYQITNTGDFAKDYGFPGNWYSI